MYSSDIRNDYTLSDAFHALGVRLYGPQWTGYEVLRHRVEDPTPTLEARASLDTQLEKIATQLSDKSQEQTEVIGKSEISRVNSELKNLKTNQSELFHQLNMIGDVHNSVIEDNGRWQRFEYVEGILLQALCNGELNVYGPSTFTVKPQLWAEMPEGFGYDLELSLIYWPSSECARIIDTGRIKQNQFEGWLQTVIPKVPHDGAIISTEQRTRIWFREQAKHWDGKTTRDQFKEMAMAEYPDLGERAFKRIWDAEAYDSMKKPGSRKSS